MTIDPRFLIDLKGKQFVLYAGLLDLATRSGLRSLEVRLLQVPAPENQHLAIAEATAVFEDGRRFVEIADAGPQNLSGQMAPAACRMAATRSKARVLRDALNVGVCSVEELPPEEARSEERAPLAAAPLPPAVPVNRNGRGPDNDECQGCGAPMREAQGVFSRQKFAGRTLCVECQPALRR